mgnify:CR=1 FL=1
MLHLSAWNGHSLNLKLLFHGKHLNDCVWVGSRNNAWGEQKKGGARRARSDTIIDELVEEDLGFGEEIAVVIPWLPSIDVAKITPSLNTLPSSSDRHRRGHKSQSSSHHHSSSSSRASSRSISRAAHHSAPRVLPFGAPSNDIYMTSLDLALLRGHLGCARTLCRAACPMLAFANSRKASYCIKSLQKQGRRIGMLRSGFARPIITSLDQLLSLSILQGDVSSLMGLLRGNERHCHPDRSLLQFNSQIRSFDTCTFDFTSYHSPTEQFIFYCRKCKVSVCMICALHCHGHCFDSSVGCSAVIEVDLEMSVKPTYCDCNKRTCQSLLRGVYDGVKTHN